MLVKVVKSRVGEYGGFNQPLFQILERFLHGLGHRELFVILEAIILSKFCKKGVCYCGKPLDKFPIVAHLPDPRAQLGARVREGPLFNDLNVVFTWCDTMLTNGMAKVRNRVLDQITLERIKTKTRAKISAEHILHS